MNDCDKTKDQLIAELEALRANVAGLTRSPSPLDAQQQLLADTALRIRQSLNLQEILSTTVNEVRHILDCDRVAIYQFRPDWSGMIAVEAVLDPAFSILGKVVTDDCFPQEWVEPYCQGQPRAIDNIDTANLSQCHVDFLASLQVQANLIVPILPGNQLWGLLVAHECQSPRHWQADEIELLAQLATQVSIAIQQSTLVNQLQAELQDRRAAEAALQASEARFRAIFEAEPECVKVVTSTGILKTINPAGLTMIEADSLEQVTGQCICPLIHPDHQQPFLEFTQQVAQDNSGTLEFEITGLQGTRRWLESHAVPLLLPGEPIPHVLAVTRDITERRRMEMALRESEEKQRLLIKYAPASIAMFDREMHYISASQRWIDDYQLDSIEAIIGRSHYEIFPEIPDYWRQIHQHCLAGAIERCNDDLFVRANGTEQWISWEIHPWYTATKDIGGIIIFTVDVTNRKQIETELQRFNQELEQRIAERTKELVESNDRLQQELFERERTKRALQTSEMRFRSTFEDAATGMALVAPNGLFLRGNAALCQFLGYSQAELREVTFQAITHPDDLATDLDCVRQLLANEIQTYQLEKRYSHKDGYVVWGLLNVSLVRNELGEPLHFISQIQDISNRKQIESALKHSQARFAGILEIATDAIISIDAQQQITLFNQGAEKIFGYKAAEILGKPLNLLLPDRFTTSHPRHVNTFKASNGQARRMTEQEVWGRRKDGSEFPAESSISMLDMGNEKISTAFLRDISDRKQAEASLAQLAAIVESSEDAIVGKSLDGFISSWNAAAERMFGYTRDEVMGQPISILFPPDHLDDMQHVLEHIRRGEVVDHYETVRQRKDGKRLHISITVSPIRDATGQIVAASAIKRDITAQKQMQQTLELQSVIMNNMAGGVCLVSATDWSIVYANPKFAAMFGYEPNELQGRSVNILNYDDPSQKAEQATAYITHQIETNGEASYEVHNIKKDGTPFWCWAHTTLFDHPDYGKVYVAVQDDITDRKQAEAALAKELSRSKALYKASFDGIVTLNKQGYVVEASHSFAQMLGYSLDETLALHVTDWDAQWTKAELMENIQTSKLMDSTFETVHRRKDGSLYDVEISATEVNLQDETVQLCICRDISERKHVEATLQESARRWRSLLDNVQLVVVELDRHGNVEYANPFFLELTNFTSTDVLGKNWMECFIPGHQKADIQLCFQEVIEKNFHPHYQNPILTKSREERMITWSNTLLRDTSGRAIGTISIGEDITERYKLERMKAEFISMVSHELRTPLTSMQAALSLLVDNIVDPTTKEGQDVIQIASTGVDRLVRLVNDILDLERLESGKIRLEKQSCNTADLINLASGQMQEMANQAGIILNTSSQSFQIYADGDRLLQVLINLLSNAIKFSSPGGGVSLDVAVIEGIDTGEFGEFGELRELGQTLSSPALLFTIRDQGRGIPNDKLESIFERFHQVDASDSREKGGTGLGLAICRSIVQQHNGQIWAESRLGQGSTFYFTLPLREVKHER
jgi:PAS domain S-box-containing protein